MFYQEAAEIKGILESCDNKSLVLIDEYARGTSHLNALALFVTLVEGLTEKSILKEWRNQDDKTSLPTCLIATNLKELITFKFLQPSPNLKIVVIPSHTQLVLKETLK